MKNSKIKVFLKTFIVYLLGYIALDLIYNYIYNYINTGYCIFPSEITDTLFSIIYTYKYIFLILFGIIFIFIISKIITILKKIYNSNLYVLLFYNTAFFLNLLIFYFSQNFWQLLLGFIFIYLLSLPRYIDNKEKSIKDQILLLTDDPIEDTCDDKLKLKDKVKTFANNLYNDGKTGNQVFGLVGGWGTGKTSFINLVENEKVIKNNTVFIRFNPWHFNQEKDLLKSFLKGIIANLDNSYYTGQLNKYFDQIIDILGQVSKNRFGIGFASKKETIDDIKHNIDDVLKHINKKIIIVIDDIDRMEYKKVLEVFKIVDLCRDFYNTTFVLCYDPNNFNLTHQIKYNTFEEENKIMNDKNEVDKSISKIYSKEIDNSEIVNYIGKIITVNYSLFIDKEKIKDYLNDVIIRDEKTTNLFSTKSINNIEESIDNLFSEKLYPQFGKYLSNIRFIKVLYNNLIIQLNIEELNKDTKYKYEDLFDIEAGGIHFDIFVLLLILNIHHKKLFDILDNSQKFFKISLQEKMSINLGTQEPKKYSDKLFNELKYLNNKDYTLIENLVNYLGNSIANIGNYFDIIKNNFDMTNIISYRKLLDNLALFSDGEKELKDILGEKDDVDYVYDVIRAYEFRLRETNQDKNNIIEFINQLIDYDKFYTLEFFNYKEYTGIFAWIQILFDLIQDEELKYNFFFEGGEYKKSLFDKIIKKGELLSDNDKYKYSKTISILEAYSLIYVVGSSYINHGDNQNNIKEIYKKIYSDFLKNGENILKDIYEIEKGKNGIGNIILNLSNLFNILGKYGNKEQKEELNKKIFKIFEKDKVMFIWYISTTMTTENLRDIHFIDNEDNKGLEFEDVKSFYEENKNTLNDINQEFYVMGRYSRVENIKVSASTILGKFDSYIKKVK